MTVSIRYAAALYDGEREYTAAVNPPAYFTPLDDQQPEVMPDGADPLHWIPQRLYAALNGVTFHRLPDGVVTSVFVIHDDETGNTCDLTAIIDAPAPVLAAVRQRMEQNMRDDRAAYLERSGRAADSIGWEDGLPDSEALQQYNPAAVIALADAYR